MAGELVRLVEFLQIFGEDTRRLLYERLVVGRW